MSNFFAFRITAARREPPAAESRSTRPASAQKPNQDNLGHMPDEAMHCGKGLSSEEACNAEVYPAANQPHYETCNQEPLAALQ